MSNTTNKDKKMDTFYRRRQVTTFAASLDTDLNIPLWLLEMAVAMNALPHEKHDRTAGRLRLLRINATLIY